MEQERNMEVLKMEVKLNSEIVSLDLSQDMVINVADINESYVDQPARYAYWATLSTLARSKANKLKQQIDKEQDYIRTTLTGSLDSKVRQQLELDGEKVTETKVSNAIYVHPTFIAHKSKLSELQEAYNEADEQARLLEVGKETMNQRKEMLISLGAQLRTDYDGVADLVVKGSKYSGESKVSDISGIVGKKKTQRQISRKAIISEESED